MKKLILPLVILLLSTTAFAQIDPDVDMMGIYFDTGANMVCANLPLYVYSSAYVCITNASAPSGVSGFEFHVDISPPPIIPPVYTLPAGALNVMSPPNFVVGVVSPLPWMPSIPVVEISIMPIDPSPIYFTLSGVIPSSFVGGFPGYAVGNDPADLRSCGYSVGSPDICAIANGPDCFVVSSEARTWGSVKSIFR